MDHLIRDATLADVRAILQSMRPMDRMEAEGGGAPARHMLHALWQESSVRRAAYIDGKVAAVWGFAGQLASTEAEGWLFTSPDIETMPLTFFRETKKEISKMLESKQVVISDCMADYGRALKFFSILGFEIGPLTKGHNGIQWRSITFSTAKTKLIRKSATRILKSPFIIYALGRSRTAWLSAFLTYQEWTCFHERALTLRKADDIRDFLSNPYVGTAETAAIQAHPLIMYYRPDIRIVVVHREVEDAIAAMATAYDKCGIPYNLPKMKSIFYRAAREMQRLSDNSNVLNISYADLDQEGTCSKLFEYCLPFSFDREWWAKFNGRKIEADLTEIVLYHSRNRNAIENFKRVCRGELVALARSGRLKNAIH